MRVGIYLENKRPYRLNTTAMRMSLAANKLTRDGYTLGRSSQKRQLDLHLIFRHFDEL